MTMIFKAHDVIVFVLAALTLNSVHQGSGERKFNIFLNCLTLVLDLSY